MLARPVLTFVSSLALVAGAALVAPSTATAAGSKVSLVMNSGTERKVVPGETIFLRGTARQPSGKAHARKTVTLYRYTGGKKTLVARTTTSKGGGYTFEVRPRSTTTYRVALSRTYSPQLKVVKVGSHSLAERERSLKVILGPAKSKVNRSGGVTFRTYKKGMLVSKSGKTWMVRAGVYPEYRRTGMTKSGVGLPVADTRCRLPEGACIQMFAKGAVYANSSARDKAVSVVSGSRNRAALAAVALSQKGYTEPRYRQSKFNRWMGRTDAGAAWCAFFTAWTSYAAGLGEAVTKRTSFAATWSAEKKRKRLRSTPLVGRVGYISTDGTGRPHHAGLVVDYDGSFVWFMEGNIDSGGHNGYPRGVHLIKRPRSQVVTYAEPKF